MGDLEIRGKSVVTVLPHRGEKVRKDTTIFWNAQILAKTAKNTLPAKTHIINDLCKSTP